MMNKYVHLLLLISASLLFVAGCASSEPDSPTPDNLDRPGTPNYEQLILDCNTGESARSAIAAGDQIEPATGCDTWEINRYERPFNANSQDLYYSDLDILNAELGRDEDWLYFRISLFEDNLETGLLNGLYAIELDLDIDGRGDVLVLARAPSDAALSDWVQTGLQFWGDIDNGVGDEIPLVADFPNNSDGFDTLVFDGGQGEDPSLAWIRMSPGKPAYVEIAFKSSAIQFDDQFKWWAWTDQAQADPALADLHDTYDHPEAGDPNSSQSFFPSKAIYALDNTCAAIWGGDQNDHVDLCVNDPNQGSPQGDPGSTPSTDETPSDDVTPTPTPLTATPTSPDTSRTPTPPTGTLTPITETLTPTITGTPCVPSNLTAANSTTCTPTVTATRFTGTPCVPSGNTASNANSSVTCTPTPTRITGTPCAPAANATTNFNSVTCTPTPTRQTATPTPTVCFEVDQSSTNLAGPRITTCTPTPTMTITPTDCIIPYAFAVINCTPTPSSTPTITPTRCVIVDDTGQTQDCTPTPTLTATATVCVHYGTTALVICTPTPSPTLCVGGTGVAALPCTPTTTPTPCVAIDDNGNMIPCTPIPVSMAAMAHPDQDYNCREAPNGNARILDTLFEGESYELRGRDGSNNWIFLRGPNGRLCWAFIGSMTFTHDGEEAELADIPIDWLSIILTPSATPTPSPDTSGGGSQPTVTASKVSVPQCSDGVDNDGDGAIDYVAPSTTGATKGDPQCSSASDNNESK
jgi:hypothetical protein